MPSTNPNPKVNSISQIRNLCVYCGSSPGWNPAYEDAARMLGNAIAKDGKGLIYGGGCKGLMGILAQSVLSNGGPVLGIMPEFLQVRENSIPLGSNTLFVPDMHTRKRLMFERADAFIALPGGIGTLEELIEQLSWVQLERHNKPVLLVNIAGFWDPLIALFDHMRSEGFIQPAFDISYLVTEKVDAIIPMLEAETERSKSSGNTKSSVDPNL